MSYTFTSGDLLHVDAKLTGNTATPVLNHSRPVKVISIRATETNGGTHTLTIDKYDGTTTYLARNARPFTANETFIDNEPILLDANQSLRATSSAANGYVDLHIIYLNPDATVAGR